MPDENSALPYLSFQENIPIIKHHQDGINEVIGRILDVNSQSGACIDKKLATQGFRLLKYFKQGSEALLFETTENQLLRICHKDNMGVPNRHPAILHPRRKFDIRMPDDRELETLTVSIMPRVRTTGVTDQHVKMLDEALLKAGYYVPDICIENVGLIDIPERGIQDLPVLIDTGLLKRIADVQGNDWELWQKLSGLPRTSEKKLRSRWLSPDGTPWQNIFDPRIGTGKPTGVIPEKELKTLQQQHPNSTIIVPTITGGGYSAHVRAALEEAAEKIAPSR